MNQQNSDRDNRQANGRQASTNSDVNLLLQAVAECTRVLLEDENFDRSVNKALAILGKSIDADRVGIGEQHDDPTGETLGYTTIAPYEWLSSDTPSQVNHAESSRMDSKVFGEDFFKLLSGNHAGGLIETYPEPFKSGQQELGVKATHAIPIMVKGEYWGFLGLDFCQIAKELAEAEIAVLKTAAACIGSAIQRERNRQAREQAERRALLQQQKTVELQTRDRLQSITAQASQALLNDEDLERAIALALEIVGQGIDTDRVGVMEHHEDANGNSLGFLKLIYEWHSANAVSQLLHPEHQQIPNEGMEHWFTLLQQGEAVGGLIEDCPEPISTALIEIGVKSTYAVPIALDGIYWGLIGFDDCKEAKQRSETEISILKTIAACIGSAIQQNRIRQAREQAERTALLQQQKAAQLEEHNLVLAKRDRILSATAEASNALLAEDDFDTAVNRALQIIGEAIDTDRVAVLEQIDDSSVHRLGYAKVIYEWNSDCAVSQIEHPEVAQVSYEGVEEWYFQLCGGKSTGGVLDELPESFRSKMAKIGVKATYIIPILVDGRFWGVIGIDDCREVTRRSEAELSILKTAAACIGSAIQQERIRREKEAAERNILLEREQAAIEQAAQLEEHNLVLAKRDRILSATAEASNALLAEDDFDTAVNRALQIIGEAIDTDRVVILEQIDDSSVHSLGYLKVIHEWDSDCAISQLEHPEVFQVSWEGMEEWYFQARESEWTGGLLEELPEPFRSKMTKIGAKATYGIPIIVNGQLWGIIGIDDCREVTRRSEAELSILKTAAACIGSAIQQERIRREKETAERNILLEREKAAIEKAEQLQESNLVLSLRDRWLDATANAANKLLQFADLDAGINTALKVLGESLDCDRVCVGQHFEGDVEENLGFVRLIYEWNSIHVNRQIVQPEFVEFPWDDLEEWLTEQKAGEWVGGIVEELSEPFRSGQSKLGVKSLYNVPIFVDGNYWGTVGIDFCREARRLTEPEIAVFKTAASCIGSAIYRQQKDEALKKSEKRYRTLFELSNEGIFRFELDEPFSTSLSVEEQLRLTYQHYRIAEVNNTFIGQYGFRNINEVVGKKLTDFYPEGSEISQAMNRAIIENGYQIDNAESEEIGFDGKPRYILQNIVCDVRDGYVYGGWGMQTDITDLKQAQQNLLEAERQRVAQLQESNQVLSLRDRWLDATANAANKLLQFADLDAGINTALRVLGKSLDCDRIGVMQHIEDDNSVSLGSVRMLHEWHSKSTISQLNHPDLFEISDSGIEETIAGVMAGDWLGGLIDEFAEPFRSGQIELGVKSTYAVPIFIDNQFWGVLTIDFCREVRRLTLPEIAVFKTAASCIGSAIYRQQIQEEKEQAELAILEERNRMAREIHDTLAQSFTGISIQLELAKEILATEPETARQRLSRAETLAKEGVVEARRSVRALRSPFLQSGLDTALRQLVQRMMQDINIDSEVIVEGESFTLPSEVETELFRVATEAVTNILRYAQASQMIIMLIYEPDTVYLQITDNGVGFDFDSVVGSSFGLLGMQERCDRIDGSLRINSAIGRGTEITVAVGIE